MERVEGGRGTGPRGVVPSSAMPGMDMHLIHPQQPQMHHGGGFQHPELQHGVGFQPHQPVPVRQQAPPSYPPYAAVSSRAVNNPGGHDEEMGNGAGQAGGAAQQQQAGAAGCPWTRMKWTDAMVRLLIMVVYNVGDDGEGVAAGGGKAAAASHGKAGGASAAAHGGQAAAQQKKGKWKSVSRAMMENNFMVSPQQCEDKFNDLNKRYKRVVDLLGRGKACRVVESPALLDSMDELAPKAKEEARKLLSSKHLFFREMCNYHNSTATVASHNAGESAGAACFHHPPPAPAASGPASSTARQQAAAPSPGMKSSSARDEDADSGHGPASNHEEEEEGEDDYDDGGPMYSRQRRYNKRRHHGEHGSPAAWEAEDEDDDSNERAHLSAVQQLQGELAAVAARGDPQGEREWMRRRSVELDEQQVEYEGRRFQLERQRLKWERFRANKERDMEHARLRNDRLCLNGRRMLLLLKQKEFDMDNAEANSSSVEHQPPPFISAFQQHIGSGPSTAGHPN